ncbi:IclR family transcriptional regulator [Saccharothrix carnea]|uniref:IclR family transcriptional regulator n=1 Tax=Saccharothrix carnea TaxID=1280637 RepID=A0A2P8HEG1_SACCR|nr:helix-turn-helix domain-containing protein [Saccharothrix carnea]PSL44612.1 IclR family transcriptional regulator [Saccharothrix carnea]
MARIVEAFGPDAPTLRVTDIAHRTGLHVATASRLVEELVSHGWLSRDADRRVRVGVSLWEPAVRASPALSLREAAMPFLEDLHAVVGHHAQPAVLEGGEALFLERLSAPGAVVNVTRIAGRLPLHASSAGSVLLAFAPARLQERVPAGPLHAFTRHTIVDPHRLRGFLARRAPGGARVVPRVHRHPRHRHRRADPGRARQSVLDVIKAAGVHC